MHRPSKKGKLLYLFDGMLAAHKRHQESGCKIWHSCCANFGCPKCHPYQGMLDKSLPNGDKNYETIRVLKEI
jgi:hypothetical protein